MADGDLTEDLHFVPAPCHVACPVGTDAPSYIGLIWEGKYEEAFEAITVTNPFSSICGRVCDAPCEPACRRVEADGALQIRNLKRFVMDRVGHQYDPPPVPVTRKETVGIVGAGPAGLTAAHDLSEAGYEVHVYEMSDRLGGMMVWGIPAFRLPPGIIDEDIDRLTRRCPGLHIHLNTALGSGVSLAELKRRHDAVLLTIGAWWGKPMGIPGEEHELVVDGVGWLREINAGQRPTLPKKVVVVGGGDVAMDACRVARRLPGCEQVTVLYRRGPAEIPARRIELEGAIAENVEFVYHTQPVSVEPRGGGLSLRCVSTELGEPDAEGRRRPLNVPGTEHDIECGMVIASVGQKGVCDELDGLGLMLQDRIAADFGTMRTTDPQVFAAGDGAFGGSTIVMAMHHGQRAAYYVEAFLAGNPEPLPYQTPFRTRRVPVAQDAMWERHALQHAEFLGLGLVPITFPEIEVTYDPETAHKEAARCYRCDAETGTPDYSVQHREDLFTMARIKPGQLDAQHDMLHRRLLPRKNPFPETRPPQLEDIVLLPANLSRLVIDPYREACRVSFDLGGRLSLAHPFLVTCFDGAPKQVREAVARGVAEAQGASLGVEPLSLETQVPWLQLLVADSAAPSPLAAALLRVVDDEEVAVPERLHEEQLTGLVLSVNVDDPASRKLRATVAAALDQGADVLLLNCVSMGVGTPWLDAPWAELAGAPDLRLLRDTVHILRQLRREGDIDLIHFGGVRSGTDAAKLIGLGAVAMALGVSAGLAAGGHIVDGSLTFDADLSQDDRRLAVANLIRANTSEASMMARCLGKTVLHNIEPEDLRALTLATSEATNLPLAGT
jgi:NADPH-dependent glutamate synthase beta subunit-like oxidoreductase